MCLPGKTRTYDLMVRSHALYPAGLRADRLIMLPQVSDCMPYGLFQRFQSLIAQTRALKGKQAKAFQH